MRTSAGGLMLLLGLTALFALGAYEVIAAWSWGVGLTVGLAAAAIVVGCFLIEWTGKDDGG
jgi:hypothetical protein